MTTPPNPEPDSVPTPRASATPLSIDTLKDIWATRPVRLPSSQGGNAKIEGVAEGIGVRYRIDPTIVRVAFVVGAVAGGGLVPYLVAILLMPRFSVPQSPGELVFSDIDPASPQAKTLKKERNIGWLLAVAIVLFGGLGVAGEGVLSVSVVLGLFAIAWFGLYQRTPQAPAGLLQPPTHYGQRPHASAGTATNPCALDADDSTGASRNEHTAPTSPSQPQVDLSAYLPAEGFASPFQLPTPPAWDPLGAAPSLWYLPEPPKAVVKQKRSWRWLWWIGVPAAASVAVLLALAGANVDGETTPAVGDQHQVITDESQLEPSYHTDVGDITLDLAELDSLSQDRNVVVTNNVGNIYVTLPETVAVKLSCDTAAGEVDCVPTTHTTGPVLIIDARGSVGDVVVKP